MCMCMMNYIYLVRQHVGGRQIQGIDIYLLLICARVFVGTSRMTIFLVVMILNLGAFYSLCVCVCIYI